MSAVCLYRLDHRFHHRGIGGPMVPYGERLYRCEACRHDGSGWALLQQAPPEFLLPPHDLYPMTQADFDHWLAILKANFPDHSDARRRDFVPRLPGDAVRNLEKGAQGDSPSARVLRSAIQGLKKRFQLDEG